MDPLLSVVVPCFNEEAVLPAFFSEAIPAIDSATDGSWQIIFVDDGSVDRSARIISEKHQHDGRVCCLRLARNFGHQAALNCGLAYAAGDYVGVLDCDLQDPVEVLLALFRKCKDEQFDIAFGVRGRRSGYFWRRVGYRIFYRAMRRLSDHEWPLDAGDFCVFNARVHRLLLSLPENVRVLRGLRSWLGLKQSAVTYSRPPRQHGYSKYSLTTLAGLATSSLVNFSTAPLRLAGWMALGMAALCFGLFALLLVNRLFPEFSILGYYIGANPGITTLGLLLCLIGAMLFLCLGILGEYIAMIIREIKRRPSAIIQERIGDLQQHHTAFRVAEF